MLKRQEMAILGKRSMITRMQLEPCDDGNPSIKSMDITDQALLGTGNGCNNLGSLEWSGLACWQTAQDVTKD